MVKIKIQDEEIELFKLFYDDYIKEKVLEIN